MRLLLIEDENPAAQRLQGLLAKQLPTAEIMAVLDSVEATVEWWHAQTVLPDLLFVDIQLADGLSFEVFETIDIRKPVIFTTAYDQYAIKAFEVNSLDYLLKPIDPEGLARALQKFQEREAAAPLPDLQALVQALKPRQHRERFLLKSGEQYRQVAVKDVAYFMAAGGLVLLYTHEGRYFPLDQTLDQLEEEVDSTHFFRLNRKFLVRAEAIAAIHSYFNHRLKLDLQPVCTEEVIVARDRVPAFKRWLDR